MRVPPISFGSTFDIPNYSLVKIADLRAEFPDANWAYTEAQAEPGNRISYISPIQTDGGISQVTVSKALDVRVKALLERLNVPDVTVKDNLVAWIEKLTKRIMSRPVSEAPWIVEEGVKGIILKMRNYEDAHWEPSVEEITAAAQEAGFSEKNIPSILKAFGLEVVKA